MRTIFLTYCDFNVQEEFKRMRKRQLAKDVEADRKAPGTGKRAKKRKAETSMDTLHIDSDDETGGHE